MNKETVTIENYQELAMRTCLPTAKNWLYAHFGLKSEVFELNAKICGGKAKSIRDGADFNKAKSTKAIFDEYGDCYWFIALICELTNSKFANVYNSKFATLKMAWKFARQKLGIFKSIIYSVNLSRLILSLKKEQTAYGFLIREVLQANVDKLQSRAQRGVLKGSGDNR